MAKTYNGWKNWNHWNVSLWINNDEGLYRLAQECINTSKGRALYEGKSPRQMAAEMFFNRVEGAKTPDGAPYSVTTIKAAMRGM